MPRSRGVSDLRGVIALTVLATLGGCATSDPARLAALETRLAHEDSATRVLAAWCGAPVVALRLDGDAPAPVGVRARLGVAATEPLAYRHVALTCGAQTLSEARNWYVPARLGQATDRELRTTDHPFGAVIAPLGLGRDRLASTRGAAHGCPRGTVLSNRAVIRLAQGQPVAFVIECYRAALLADRQRAGG